MIVIAIVIARRKKKRKNHDSEKSPVPETVEMSRVDSKCFNLKESSRPLGPSMDVLTVTKDSWWRIEYSQLEFDTKIGAGGYGVVYKGSWKGNTVAIKMLHKCHFEGNISNCWRGELQPQQYEEFKREAALMANMEKHPNVIRLYGAVLEDGECPPMLHECSRSGCGNSDRILGKGLFDGLEAWEAFVYMCLRWRQPRVHDFGSSLDII